MEMLDVIHRLHREKRWSEAEPIKNDMMREARRSGLSKEDAQKQVYAKLHEMFPPIEDAKRPDDNQTEQRAEAGGGENLTDHADATGTAMHTRTQGDSAAVIGLGDIPPDWPALASNATLGVEIQWVQANRLSVVRETRDGATVDLSRAMTPAPSWAALGWLETSIRAYAKFVDVAAKASATLEDEREMVRRERLAIDEIRSLLAEMQAE